MWLKRREDEGGSEKDTQEGDTTQPQEDAPILSPFAYSERTGDPALIELLREHAKVKPKPELDAFINVRLAKVVLDQVNEYVQSGYRRSASQFVRDSIDLNLTVQERLKDSGKVIDEIALELISELSRIPISTFISQLMTPLYRIVPRLSTETLAEVHNFAWDMMVGALAGLCGVSQDVARMKLMTIWLQLTQKARSDGDKRDVVYDETLWSSIAVVIAGYTGVPVERAKDGLSSLRDLLDQEAAGSGGVSDTEMEGDEA